MICHDCGAWTKLLETRTEFLVVKRRRYECANMHRFTTYEVPVAFVSYLGRSKWAALCQQFVRVFYNRTALHKRGVAFARLKAQNQTNVQIAKANGITENAVRNAIKRYGAYVYKRPEKEKM